MLQQAMDAVVGRRPGFSFTAPVRKVCVHWRAPRLEEIVEVSSSSKPLGSGPPA